jgi:chromosome segregation ATPase
MKKKALQNRLLAFLGIVLLLLLIAYFITLGEKYRLKADLVRVRAKATTLEIEKQKLLRQIEKQKAIQEQLDAQSPPQASSPQGGEIIIIQPAADSRYGEAQKIIEELNLRLASLKDENQTLKDKEVQLNAQIANLSQENSILKTRLGSIPELKKAIREAKQRMRQMNLSLKNKSKAVYQIIGGNRGYLIKDGQVSKPAKVKIEVKPAQ